MDFVQTLNDTPVTASREELFEDLYENAFPAFARFAANRHASLADTKDIFHDALVIYYEKCLADDFTITSSNEAYVIGIAKHLWIRKFQHDRNNVSFTEAEAAIQIPPDYYPTVNETRLLKFLEVSGKRCLELLQKFYYEQVSLREIAASLGFRNEHSAAVKKFKCIGKMRDAIRSKSMDYEDFLE